MTKTLFVLLAAAWAGSLAAQPCCVITAIQPNGAVAARVNASGQQFQFSVPDAALLRSLKVGQGIYANLARNQVSIDGKTVCCTITSGGGNAATPAPAAAPAPPATIAPGQGPGWEFKHVTANVGGRSVAADQWRLAGAAGVQASNLPAGYRDALAQKAKTLPADSVFLVSKPGVDRWVAAHPPGTPQSLSVGDVLDACAEKTESQSIPVQFSRTFDLPYTLNNTSVGGGVSVSGSVDIKFPFSGNFNAEVQAFYNPCLFYVRPKALRTAGTMSLGAQMSVDVKKVNFKKDIPIPTQPITFPLLKGAVVIEGVVVEAGVDLFVQGGVDINAQAEVDVRYTASGSGSGPFDFSCDGQKCGGNLGFTPTFTSSGNVSLAGQGVRASVTPYVFGGLQFEVEEGNVLSAQIGPRPALIGDFWAYAGPNCGSTGAVNALTADIDAGIDVRYQLKTPVVRKSDIIWAPPKVHLGFWDLLGNSTGLTAVVTGNAAPAAGSTSPYTVRMRPCYPYTDRIQYSVNFSNNPLIKTVGAGLDLREAGSQGSPQDGVTVNHNWPSPGNFNVSASAVKDAHGRVFGDSPTQFNVHVQ